MIWRGRFVRYRNSIINRCLSKQFNTYTTYRQQLSTSAQVKDLTGKANTLSVGTELHNFRVSDVVAIPEVHCKLIRLSHLGTGAQYTHIARNDSNNVFAIAFRTTPFDSTGSPHILEHITLMGSQKYPCRDPFFKMLNRSLATYLNACTGADFTVYPFATRNRNDYYNLMSVYLDAVFRPKLREIDFRMEGWRLEHEEVTDPKSPIIFKGVVFNEMKGVFSENQNIFTEAILNNLLPSHTYSVCSGGDPMVIPHLSYHSLVEFHRDHYHPSNSRIYSYGNFDLVDHLRFVDENYLRHYEGRASYAEGTAVPPEKRWLQPRRKHICGKYDPFAADSSKQSIIAAAYLCADVKNVHELFELKVLAQLLTEGPNASFYKSLIEPNIGSGYAPGTGFDTQTRDTTFIVGLQGVNDGDFEKIEILIDETFEKCIRDGFAKTNIESILHGIELSTQHQGSDFGLNLLFNVTPLWNHDGDLAVALKNSEHVARFRKNLAEDPSYLQKIVEKHFKRNTHRLILTMSPDEHYETRLQERENKLLLEKLSELSENEVSSIYDLGLELRREQEKKDDMSCLPTLRIADISERSDFPPITNAKSADIPLQVCTVPTNRVTYFRSLLDISELSDEQKSLLPLFVQIVSLMGTKRFDYQTFDQMMYVKTSGLNVGVHVSEDLASMDRFEESISLGSFCLDKNVNDMFDLWTMLFNEVSLTDVARFSTLVRNLAGSIANGVADSGHRFAMLYASSLLTPSDRQRELFGGLTFVQRMKKIAGTEDLGPLLEDMRTIAQALLTKKRMRIALNLSPEQNDAAVGGVEKFVSSIGGCYEGAIRRHVAPAKNTSSSNSFHFVLPFAVNYTSKATLCVPYTDPDFPAVRVLSKLITTKYLLPLVRERYGAYGCGASALSSGTLIFYSYRDPNSTSTLNIFDEAGDWLQKNEFSDSDVDEAKLGVFRDTDAPIAPCEEGMRMFLNGIDNELFAQHRIHLLKVKREDLLNVGRKYLGSGRPCSQVIIGADGQETSSWQKIYSD